MKEQPILNGVIDNRLSGITDKLCKIIVNEKVTDADAFNMASRAFAEGFQGLSLGEIND
jgi:hypothetical protein